ncbi:terminase large subunit [uncultured Dysgonomonas sp.]|uniref:PBSX family phage terminase, large subunit n=1 Tax=uncultured Dysgonomonas sp. TaxID=206096 RepID=A0A212K2Y9_9BACT|nr:terminase large subunit [uncultured Dysgonomonas sp.]SBW06059.1 PBSX family phage terminase, large subunit [uncultured Dysgonomonas sp.]
MKTTSVFKRNLQGINERNRYIVNKGSTRSSKTYSILQLLHAIASHSEVPRVISVVSESMPHLKRGCIRDFMDMLQREGMWEQKNWNATDKIYRVNNSIIEFFSADNPGKVHGPSRNILYINECINIDYEVYRQLAIRTTEYIILDCNPCFEFWLDEKVLVMPEAKLIHSTYRDNEFLSGAQVREIESNRGDEDWWQVYGEGLTGTRQGVIVRNWDIVQAMPEVYKKRWLGIDFGFTNDPTAIVDIRLANGELWIDELLYAKGYDNLMIAESMRVSGIPRDTPVIADSAEPKSIKEISAKGWKVEAAQKGKDSINSGISVLNRYRKHVSARSANIINEYRNYCWKTDEFGNVTNTPIDKYNHSIDAQRYVCLNKLWEKGGELSYSVIRGK